MPTDLDEMTAAQRGLTDRDVLLAGRRARIAESKANAERWSCLAEFYCRRLATEEQRRRASPHFALTARQETVVEIGSLWGMDAARVRTELNVALFLSEHSRKIWEMCLAGQVDGYRASLIADAARQKLDDAGLRHRAGSRRQLCAAHGGRVPPSDTADDAAGLGRLLVARARARRVSVRSD